MNSHEILHNGTVDPPSSADSITGYSIIEVEDMTEAEHHAEGNLFIKSLRINEVRNNLRVRTSYVPTAPAAFNSPTAASLRPSHSPMTSSVCSPSIGEDLMRTALPSTRTGQPGILKGSCTG